MMIIATLNARLQPLDRGDLFEDPLDYVLQESGKGKVTGGGTQLGAQAEIEYCEIEMMVREADEETVNLIVAALEKMGAPNGSRLKFEDSRPEIAFGQQEGLAVYLNGTDLPQSTYEQCDINVVYEEFEKRLEGIGQVQSFWEGPRETALYLYGQSFSAMKAAIADFLDSYPLCDKARIVQIA
jgi:hypothetical protein